MTSFSDDFNRANGTDLGSSWVEVSGDWSIVSNQLSPGAAGGTIILRAADAMASNDHYAQATFAATTAASQGIWCRGNANISSGYLWRNDGSSWDLFRVVGGSFTVIGTYAVAAVAGDVAKVQAVGSTITAFVNGVQRVSVVDAGVATGTGVGIRSESVAAIRFDDFAAADVTAGAALGIASASETAQLLSGSKAAPLSSAVATEVTQTLAGSKATTLSNALEIAVAQTLAGSKAAPLPVAAQTETAQPLTGAKSAILAPAAEVGTARPLAAAGPDEDVDITVGVPYSTWSADAPRAGRWKVAAPWS